MDISVKQLEEATSIRRQIDNLQQRLSSILRGTTPRTGVAPAARAPRPAQTGRYFSPATRAKLAAAAKARWARLRGGATTTAATPARKKGQLTEAFRADEGALGSKKKSIEVTSRLKRLMPFVEG